MKNKKSKQVIVAVIDSGVETDHEDLKDVIWVNEDEIPNNNIDDDENGYIDDVHGWSFLGGKTEDINYESYELARMYHNLNSYFSVRDTNNLSEEDALKYKEYLFIEKEYYKESKQMEAQIKQIQVISEYIERVKSAKGVFTKKTNKKYNPTDKNDASIKKRMKIILLFVKPSELEKQMSNASKQLINSYELNKSSTDSIRKAIVGDNARRYF